MLLQPLNVPGKITSLAHDGCLIELGAVVASVSRATLDQLAQSMQELRKLRGAAEGEVAAVQLPQMTDWTSIGYWREKDLVVLNLRGVCWYPTYTEVEEFVEKAAVPYLARGTTEMLLTPRG